MNKPKLTTEDYCDAAKDLRCEVAALMAVASVESDGGGYDDDGRIKVRFEGHKFREYTGGKFDRTHPHLSYPYKYQKGKPHGYSGFNEALALDERSALKASSFGKFQPLAVNYREADFATVQEFVEFLRESERNQLMVFCAMVKFRKLDDELRLKDWAGFARNYNGSAYRDNDYDGKMRRAYERFKKQSFNCDKLSKSNAAGNVSHNSVAIPATMSDTNLADESNGSSASDGATSTQTTIKTDTVEIASTAMAGTTPHGAKNFDSFIPQIDTAKSYLKKLFTGSALATALAFMLGLPVWMQIALAALVLIIVIGGIVIFARYYKDIFAFVTAMNTLRATQGVDNPILTTEKTE